jgi:hypothetical protein
MRIAEVDTNLEKYPTWRDLWRARFAYVMLVGGIIGARFYFGSFRNPLMDFAIWAPVALGMAFIMSQVAWQTGWPHQKASEFPLLSGVVFLAVCVLVGLIIG